MRFSKNAFAVAAVCAATAAATAAPFAGRIAKSAGSSSIQGNLNQAVRSLCKAPNVPTSFVSGNYTTVVCADVSLGDAPSALYSSKPNHEFWNFAGLPFAEVRFNMAAGSFGSEMILNGVPLRFLDPGFGGTIDMTGYGVIIGGFSDIQTDLFPAATIGSNILHYPILAGVAQTFGVAASTALYTKMFDAQKAMGMIPASCTVNDTGIKYCIPSIFRAQMATIMAGNEFNAAYQKGLQFLTNDVTDAGVELRYVRGLDTSGAQATAQHYFLGLPCTLNSLSIVAQPTTIDPVGGFIPNVKIQYIRVYAAWGTDNVRSQLNMTDADRTVAGIQPVYALGIVSGENDQTGQLWRWLRVDGAPIGENAVPGTAGNTNVNTLKDGSYSFYSEVTFSGGNPTNDGYLSQIAGVFQSMYFPIGLVPQRELDSGYGKSGLNCLGSSSN